MEFVENREHFVEINDEIVEIQYLSVEIIIKIVENIDKTIENILSNPDSGVIFSIERQKGEETLTPSMFFHLHKREKRVEHVLVLVQRLIMLL